MPFRQAALTTCTILGLGHWIWEAAYAADAPIDARPMAEQRMTVPGGNAVSVWTDISHIRIEDKRFINFSRSQGWQSTTGIDYAFGQALTIGGGVSVGGAHATEFTIPGKTETDSVIGFARATTFFLNNFNAGIIAGYGVSETEGSRLIAGALDIYSRDADVAFIGAHVGASFENQGFFVNPSARLLMSRTDYDPFRTSLGVGVPSTRDDFTRASFGGDLGYRIPVGGVTVTPSLRAFFVYDLDLPDGLKDRTAIDLSAALNVQSGILSAGVEAFTTLGRSDLNTYAVRGYASYRF